MPLAAYFRNVGAALFALLMIADFYLPKPAVTQVGSSDPAVIRIHSDRKWPERLDFDTTQVVIAAAPSPWDRGASAPPAAREMPTNRADEPGARDALALMSRQDLRRVASVEQRKTAKHAARGTRKHPRPQTVKFAWFGFRQW
jgi:hypothetical protein